MINDFIREQLRLLATQAAREKLLTAVAYGQSIARYVDTMNHDTLTDDDEPPTEKRKP